MPAQKRRQPSRPRITRRCVYCDAEFTTYASKDSRLCSRKCQYASRKSEKRETRSCLQCDTKFETYPSVNKRYCSRQCRWASAEDRALETRRCPGCGETFQAWPSQSKTFCNQQCAWAARGVELPLQPRTCRFCKESFSPTSTNQRTCVRCSGGGRAAKARLARYGLSVPAWEALQARHEGMCWICRKRPGDNVDHCHATGKVRGALCRACNMALHFVERPDWWSAAQTYLEGGGE